jgi:hypothetical protein
MAKKAKPAGASGGHRTITVSNWKPLNNGSLRGFLTLTLPSGLIIHNCQLLETAGQRCHHPRTSLAKRKDQWQGPAEGGPFTWVESVSGHHALVSHVDACFGLEREINENGDELIVFGGVARNAVTSALLLEEDDQTLMFTVSSGYDAALAVMTPKELDLWNCAQNLKRSTFTELLKHTGTTNKKALSSMLRKAVCHNVMKKDGNDYVAL